MTKKHYKLFAEALSLIPDTSERHKLAKVFCQVCKQDNPRFNTETFLLACNIYGDKENEAATTQ
jgi:hypothetical protein